MANLSKLIWPGCDNIYANIKPVTLTKDENKSVGRMPLNQTNLVMQGDNVEVMKTLMFGQYRLMGQVDLMLCDPPYNTGNNDFCYEDNFYLSKKEVEALSMSSQDPDAGHWVKAQDASRHSKWLSFMKLRLRLMRRLLKASGVIAVHIGPQELFRLGLLMDDIFGEENRLGIVTWECAYSPKASNPNTTDYVLVYAKNVELAYQGFLPRTEEMDAKYGSPDNDKDIWRSDNLSVGMGVKDEYIFGIQNPFTAEIHFPPGKSCWRHSAANVAEWLCGWGVDYHVTTRDGKPVVAFKGSVADAKKAAETKLARGTIRCSPAGRDFGRDIWKRPLSGWI